MKKKRISTLMEAISVLFLMFALSSCVPSEEMATRPQIEIISGDIIITRAGGEAELEFKVIPADADIEFIWDGPDANIYLDSFSTESDSQATVSSNVYISRVFPSIGEPGRYTATVAAFDPETEGEDSLVMTVSVFDSQGRNVYISSQPFTVSFGMRPKILGINVAGVEAELRDGNAFYVKLPYGTDTSSLESEFSSNGDVVVEEQPAPTTVDLSNPVSLTAVMGTDSVQYSLTAYYSDLPVVYVSAPSPIESRDEWVRKCSMQIVNSGEYDGIYHNVQMKGRGNSTWGYPKKPYAVKLDKKEQVLGMPKHKRWCLLANWVDRTNLRNDIALEIARRLPGLEWTPRGRFVDLVFNGKFQGNYYICEQIKVDPNRVAVDEMSASDVSGRALTGGYLLELDSNFDEVNKFRSKLLDFPVNFKDPDEDVLQPEQFAYMEDYFNKVEAAVMRYADYKEIQEMIDIDSFIDWWLVYELSANWEPNHPKSSYMYKKRGGLLYAGPVWDFDWGTFKTTEGWLIKESIWYSCLFKYPEFIARVKERWRDAQTALKTIPDYIQSVSDQIRESTEYDYSIWPIEDRVVNADEHLSFPESVDKLKQFYITRFDWLNANIASLSVE